ncbi:flagellar motor protein [Neomoorella thermoacetica]|uniref:Chemotaxis protein PomA n=1 Tax=Neomoorella thermoacetica TaxID=1525 RepID=A0A1J5JYC3_NEOTH|nr:flagellar motor protein [Moorella thermoacetica]APC08935.1 chemotaxis protein PomA [Moorella thermoacetica]OIQ09543.1 chemotaxis protein PomA [Moorella thermoacetica]
MDLASILGLATAIAAIIIALTLEGNSLTSLINLPAIIIILGGTIGATAFSYPLRELSRVPGLLGQVFQDNHADFENIVNTLVDLAETARREGLLALESRAQQFSDPLLRHGLSFAVDGIDPEEIRRIMENEIMRRQQDYKTGAGIFETAGGYAPTMGIIGTVIGLVHVLSNISDTTKLAAAIAVAFLATLYGIASANIIWLPMAAKLKTRAGEKMVVDQIIMEGILGIVQGKNPRLIRRELGILAEIETSGEV